MFAQRLAKRNIHVKRFDDIPMADTEMIFPDKRVYVKPIVLIQLLVTIVLGLVAAVTTFFSVRAPCVLVAQKYCMGYVQGMDRMLAAPRGLLFGKHGVAGLGV